MSARAFAVAFATNGVPAWPAGQKGAEGEARKDTERGADMSSGFDEIDRQHRFADRGFPGSRFPPSGRRGVTSLARFLLIALCCALFLGLVVLRG